MGKSKQTQTSSMTQNVTNTLDPNQQAQWNGLISAIQNSSYQPFVGQQVADPNANQLAAWQQAGQIGQLGQGQLNAATQAAMNATGYSPQMIQAQQLKAAQSGPTPMAGAGQVGPIANIGAQQVGQGQITQGAQQGYDQLRGNVRDVAAGQFGNIDPYMNEYNNQVVNTALGDIERSRQMAANTTGDAAAAAGAFGGSRHGVAESLTNAEYGRQAARTAADLRARGFDTAAALQQQDLNRRLQAGGMNQSADMGILGQTMQQAGQTAFNNQNAALTAGMSNQRTQLAAGQTNAQLSTQASLANAANALNNQQFNAAAQNQIGMANQGANLQAGMANQGAGLAGNAQMMQGAGLLGNLGAQAQSMGMNGMNALGWAGGQQYGIDQAGLNANYQNYLNQQGWDQQRMQNWMNAMGMQPNLVNTSVQGTNRQTVQKDRFGQVLGLGLTAAGALLGGPAGASAGAAVGGALGANQPMNSAFSSMPFNAFSSGIPGFTPGGGFMPTLSSQGGLFGPGGLSGGSGPNPLYSGTTGGVRLDPALQASMYGG